MPPVGAGPVRVTVPLDCAPPWTEVGESAIDRSADGLIVNVALFVTEERVAFTVTVVATETAVVVTVKLAVVDPATTVTVAGTTALVELDDNVMTDPPAGAGLLSVIVPVEEVPPVTDTGESETD